MKHLKIAVIRTKGLPLAGVMACVLSSVVKLLFPKLQGIGNTLVLCLILFVVIAILDLIYAYLRDIVDEG